MSELQYYITQPYETYTHFQFLIEIIAAFLGVLSVFFATKNNIWVFPTGIISTGLYVFILFSFSLFGDMTVNFYYFIMSIYGWVHWSGKDNQNIQLPITTMGKKGYLYSILLFIGSILFVISVYYFSFKLNHSLTVDAISQITPFHLTWINKIDIFTTSIFFVGMWLMAKRKIENWILWIIGDILVIPMFLEKGLAITAFQYIIFLILAFMGYNNWKKEFKLY